MVWMRFTKVLWRVFWCKKQNQMSKKPKPNKVVYAPKDAVANHGKPSVFRATLVLLVDGHKVALGMKRAKIGKGFYNGPGGGIEGAETPKMAALRELKEEFGVTAVPRDARKVALVTFVTHNEDGTLFTCHMHVFMVGVWRGKLCTCEPRKIGPPKWFGRARLPAKLMAADKHWLPLVLEHERIKAVFHYGPGQRRLIGKFVIEFTDKLDEPMVLTA